MPQLVAIADQLLAPVPGGTGRYTRELLRALAATAPPGWELASVVSRAGRGSAADAEIPGVDGPRTLRLPRRVLARAWERGVPLWPGGDSVHAMTPLAPPARRHRGLIVTVHDTVPWTHPETLTPRGAAWHRRAIAGAAREAGAVVVPTETVAADLRSRVEVTVPVHVVGEGATPSVAAVPEVEGEIAERLRLPRRYVLAVGTLEPRKGYETLVRAMAETEAPDVPALIAGHGGWGGVDLADLARSNSLAPERVRHLGPVTDTELAVILRRATVLAAPSLAEGFGLPLVEAMTAGVPVVHSDAPALVEVAGQAGVVVPRADPPALAGALRAVVDDPDRRAALVAAGMRRARLFDWQRAAREVWRIHLGARR